MAALHVARQRPGVRGREARRKSLASAAPLKPEPRAFCHPWPSQCPGAPQWHRLVFHFVGSRVPSKKSGTALERFCRTPGRCRGCGRERGHLQSASAFWDQRILASGRAVLMPSSMGILSVAGVRPVAAMSLASWAWSLATLPASSGLPMRFLVSPGSSFRL